MTGGNGAATQEGRQRVVIERVTPEIDAGRFPAKRTAGDKSACSCMFWCMAQRCTVCHDPRQAEVDRALGLGAHTTAVTAAFMTATPRDSAKLPGAASEEPQFNRVHC